MTESAKIGLPRCVLEPEQARGELRRFFAGLGVAEGPGLERLVERAMLRWQELRGVAPTSVAGWLLAASIGGALGPEFGPGPDAATARAAVLLAGAGQRWADCLLAERPLPDELARALRAALPRPVPHPLPLAMPAQSLAPAALGRPRLVAWGLGAEQRS